MKKILLAFAMLFAATQAYGQSHASCTTPTVACGQQIVTATYHEFPELANDGMNTDSMEKLLRRMIWHLQLNGIQAGRQRNPSGRISQDKLAAFIDGEWRAYDVLSDRADPGPFRLGFDEVPGANHVPDAGIADEGGGTNPPPSPPTGGSTSILDKLEAIEREEIARDAANRAKLDLLYNEVLAARQSLEEHRAEARKTKSTVMRFLSDWRNYVKIGSAIGGSEIIRRILSEDPAAKTSTTP